MPSQSQPKPSTGASASQPLSSGSSMPSDPLTPEELAAVKRLAREMIEDEEEFRDRRRYKAMQPVFIDSVLDLDPDKTSNRDAFIAIFRPLMDEGMTRAEVAAFTPCAERFIADWKAGRIKAPAQNSEPAPAPTAAKVLPPLSNGSSMQSERLTEAQLQRAMEDVKYELEASRGPRLKSKPSSEATAPAPSSMPSSKLSPEQLKRAVETAQFAVKEGKRLNALAKKERLAAERAERGSTKGIKSNSRKYSLEDESLFSMGLDGPDSFSPPDRWQEEMERVQAIPAETPEQKAAKAARLADLTERKAEAKENPFG